MKGWEWMGKTKFLFFIFTLTFLIGTATASVSYDSSDNHIDVDGNTQNLTQVAAALNNPSILSHDGKIWRMTAALHHTGTGYFYINDSDVSELRISNSKGYEGITGNNFKIEDVTLGSWNAAQNRYASKGLNEIINLERQCRLDLGQGGWIRNCVILGMYGITYTGQSDGDLYNLTIKNSNAWAIQVDNWHDRTIKNLNINNSADGGVRLQGGKGITVSDFNITYSGNWRTPHTGCYAIALEEDNELTNGASNCVIRDGYVDMTGWSAIGEGGKGDAIPYNDKFINLVIKHGGHNGLDLHGGAGHYVDNVSIYDCASNNFYSTSKDIYAKNIHLYRNGVIGDQLDIDNPGYTDNHTFINVDMHGPARGLVDNDDQGNSTWINVTDYDISATRQMEQFYDPTESWRTVTTGDGDDFYFSTTEGVFTPRQACIVDSTLNGNVRLEAGKDIRFVNTKLAKTPDRNSGISYKTYLYPNIVVIGDNGEPVANAVITCSNGVNGWGKSQTSFVTSSNGKIEGERSNWLALPYQTVLNSGTQTQTSSLTVSKDGVSGSFSLTPAASWLSPTHAGLQGTLYKVTLGVEGEQPENNTTEPPVIPENNTTEPPVTPENNTTEPPVIPDEPPIVDENDTEPPVIPENNTTEPPIIPPDEPIEAGFDASVYSGYAPLNVSFTDHSTGSPSSWYWTFGDGTNSTVQNPTHTYKSAGTFKATLKVGDDSVYSYITVKRAYPPVSYFSAYVAYGGNPKAVKFVDRSTGYITSYRWAFGDGTYSNEKSVIHAYRNTGRYVVSHTVTNSAGSSTAKKTVYIRG
jgi:PKD repeat protein